MGLFKKIQGAKVSKGGNYIRAGHYMAFLRHIKKDESRKGIPYVAIELVILDSLDNTVEDAHRVGEEVAHLMMGDQDSFLGNFKGFIANIAGVKEDDIDEESAEEVISELQPLSGRVIELTGRNIVTRAGKDFTVIDYKRTLTLAEVEDRIAPDDLKKALSAAEIEGLQAG